MEVTDPSRTGHGDYALHVQQDCDVNSSLVAKLRPYTQLKVLGTRELSDGTRRALVVVHLEKNRPLGWITAVTANGNTAIHAVARPIYQVVRADRGRRVLEVSMQLSEASTPCGDIELGTRLLVLEMRRTMHGAQRARVKIVGQHKSLGWITARKPDGTPMMCEVRDDELFVQVNHGRRHASPAPQSGRTPRTQKTPRSARRGLIRSPAVPRTGHYQPEPATEVAALTTPTKLCSKVQASVERLTSRRDRKFGGHGLPVRKESAALGPNSSYNVVDKAVKDCFAKQDRYMSSKMLEQEATALEQRAVKQGVIGDESLSAKVGATLEKKRLKIDDLLREWDPKDKGTVTKQEFRVHIRALFAKTGSVPDNAVVDNLFMELDENGNGNLDVPEIKVALKKLKSAAAAMKADEDAARVRATALRDKATCIREGVKATTVKAEQIAEDLKILKRGNLASRLGDHLHKHGIKAAELAAKWDKNGTGEVSKPSFRGQVLALDLDAKPDEVDTLFDSLDDDKGGALDVGELKRALRKLQEQAENKKQNIFTTGLRFVEAFGHMKTAQADHKAQKQAEEMEVMEQALPNEPQ